MLHRFGYAFIVLLVLGCVSPEAWAGKVGPEFRVNTTRAEDQFDPSVAALRNGSFVVVWVSGDFGGYDVYGQRYNAAGARVGAEFRVNTDTLGEQSAASVAGLKDGGFVVTWQSWYDDGFFATYGVSGQRYTAAGAPVGGEFQVNSRPVGLTTTSVAGLNNGGFVVIWTSYSQDTPEDVYGQRYSAAGRRLGREFRVNTYRADFQDSPSVAPLSDGGFVVTWTSRGQDGSGDGVYGQRFGAGGRHVGGEFRVNATRANHQFAPSVAQLGNGGFVVTWTSRGQDGSRDGVYGQRYASSGARVRGVFRVNTTRANDQSAPSVAQLDDGGFVVTWTSRGQDGSKTGVYGQRYASSGARVGREFQVNTYIASIQANPAIAPHGNGGFVVTWMSGGQDGFEFGIYGQRFDP